MAESLQRNLYSLKVYNLNEILGDSLKLLKRCCIILHHQKYKISKIVYSQIKEQSFIFQIICICEKCICVFILSPMKISGPAVLLNLSILFDRSLCLPKRVHRPARGNKTSKCFPLVLCIQIYINNLFKKTV